MKNVRLYGICQKNAFLAEFLQKCMSRYKQQQDVAIIALAQKSKRSYFVCLLSYIHYNLRSCFELCFDIAGRLEIPVDFWPTSILAAGNSVQEQTQTAKSSQLRVPLHYDGVLQSHRKNNLVKFDLFVINGLCRWLFFSRLQGKCWRRPKN